MSSIVDDFLGQIVDEVATAVQSDLSNPDTVALLRETIDQLVMQVTHINVKNPFIYPHYNKVIEKYQNQVLEVLGIATSNPPESVDETASYIKEEVTTKVDSFADRLKKRLEAKSNPDTGKD